MRKLIFTLMKIFIIALILIIGVNVFVIRSVEDRIVLEYDGEDRSITTEGMTRLTSIEPDCILVLGASVNPDGTPSNMLQDRLDTAITLYREGAAPKLLLSGDNGQEVYDEVGTMKDYVVKAGIPEEDIFLDHAGFSTYESIYRAGYIFEVKSMIVVTQKYHLYRALYGCEKMGIKALGAAAEQEVYSGQEKRELREVLARDKDGIKWIVKPEPTFLGDAVPIGGSGTPTH